VIFPVTAVCEFIFLIEEGGLMRVLLIGQKIVTLEDLESYFFEHHIHGYANVGAPNLLSLDVVRQCGIHMVICQSSDYTMEHLLTFLQKVKHHDPAIVTLLITLTTDLTQLGDNTLDDVDDFMVLPFTPAEFHARLLKLISRSLSPDSIISAEDRLKNILDLMSEHPNFLSDAFDMSNQVIDEHPESADAYIPNMELFTNSQTLAGLTPVDPIDDQTLAGLTPMTPIISVPPMDTTPNTTIDSPSEATADLPSKETLKAKSISESDMNYLADLLQSFEIEHAPSNETELNHLKATFNGNSTEAKSSVISIPIHEAEIPTEDEDRETSRFNRFMEWIGRLAYIIIILFLILFSVYLIKSTLDGGVATFGEYGVYANTGDLLEPWNGQGTDDTGALILSQGVSSAHPKGSTKLRYIPYLGYLADFTRTPLGLMMVIIGPLILILAFELYDLWRRRFGS
jgi:hypothetical protein